MRAQFTALRSEVDSVVGHLRSEVETRQQGVTGDTLDAWTDTYARVAERRGDLLVKLDDLDRASVDEARSIRNDVANELAELEADVVRQKLRYGGDRATPEAVEEHLVRLEQNLDSIEARSRAIHGGTAAQTGQQGVDRTQDARAMGGVDAQTGQQTRDRDMGTDVQRQPGATDAQAQDTRTGTGTWGDGDRHDHVPDMDEIRNLREDIQETRRDVAELRTATADDRRDRMDNISDQVADLTREVRKHWYNVRYSFTGTGTTGQMDRQRMDDDTQY
ncbi:MAG: hypothetical protein EA350_07100 [Gemmatimonadales bacterium]|nr:MAG: hypothetical protein EA350_07100 [Gemmatimonadales bacterium]